MPLPPRTGPVALGLLLVLLPTWLARPAAAPSSDVDFNRQVRPILSEKCFRCHGPDAAQRKAGLRLDQRESAVAGEQPALVPGRPQESELYRRITATNARQRMPPARSGLTLTPGEFQVLRRWIEQGARYQPHWSLVPPRLPTAPDVRLADWPRNPIDHFVLSRLESEGLRPSPDAPRAALLRRVTLDLTGLSPTPAELDAFLADDTPGAYERVVDRLLASPRYGERLALDWLDAARYADTNGYFSDQERQLWRWRDWVIDSFNRNMPFDRFTVEQLAGDLLPGATQEQLIATGFHRNHMVTNESGAIDEEYRVEYVADRVDTTATVWLGLTAGCARCHDHKYDPISQKEYYQLFAYFNRVPEQGLVKQANPPPLIPVPSPEQQRALDDARRRRAEAEQHYRAQEPALHAALARWEPSAVDSLPAAPTAGLLAHHDFENRLAGPTGFATAVAHGTPGYDAGILGAGLVFEGSQDVELPAGPDLDAPWSLSVWVRPGGGQLGCVLSRVRPGDDWRGFELLWKKSHVLASLVHRRGVNAVEVSTEQTLKADEWHQVVVTYDGSGQAAGLRLFVDGEPQGKVRGEALAGPVANGQPWLIGRRDPTLGFTGRLDELRFYGRPLEEGEVRDLFWGELVRGTLKAPAGKRSPRQKDLLLRYFLARHASAEARAAWERLDRARHEENEAKAAIPTTLVMREMDRPRETFVLVRGQYDKHGEKVSAGVPAALPPPPADAPADRLGLARWLVSPGHPLTARVTVNRFWQQCFGEGLVKTVNDLGSQGELPSHPELLDWLAVTFVRSGWDVKALHRLIVTSATYCQSSAATPALLHKDPDNRLLARGARFRLPAELIRDQVLAASGQLVERPGGPSVKPYQPPGLWEAVTYDGELTYVPDRGAGLYRRSLYTYWKRQAPPPALLTFDGPTRETCVVKRQRTNTPLQALVLMNDPTYVEAARVLAERVLRRPGDPDTWARDAFRRVVGRTPRDDEAAALLRLYRRQRDEYRDNRPAALKLLAVGAAPRDPALDPCELAAWTTVVSALFNLDETITRP